ncbi:C40 family peptidase [Tumebacillus sp. ITR2]|uniref:C40 family peptidase n=2 Tax=Tumebacillus amylolyticus TaxID=2801339 RepID=A0ABS1JA29_9BACL|nr:C40 family peptidase [Tumebacillus amylolyticus]
MESVTNLRVLLEEKRLQAPPPPPPPKLSSRGGLLQAPKPQQTQSTNRSAPESNPAPTILNQGQSGATATQTGKLAAVAVKYQGSPYAFGGTTPGGFDCSGFIQYVFQECGISLPRTTYEQIGAGIQVSRANLQPGDLVFFSCGGQSTSHAGIYLGDGRFIHADQTHGVHIAELSNTYWASAYQTGVRVR